MGARAESATPGRGALRFLRDIVIILVCALLISFLVKTFVVRSFYIPSGSMEPTLQIGDRILVNEFVPKLSAIKRGDVVVFTDPGGWLENEGTTPQAPTSPVVDVLQKGLTAVGLGTQDSDDHLIKRVIGLPGDHVTCCSAAGHIEVNGQPIDEPYAAIPSGSTDASKTTFDITVPKGELWVMGDNRYDSADSAYHEALGDHSPFVPVDDVVGRAFVITWPSSDWGTLSDYPSVFAKVPAASASK